MKVVSAYNRYLNLYVRARDRDTLSVICRPYRFRAAQLERSVKQMGFEIVWKLRRQREDWQRLVGHAFQSLPVARRPVNGISVGDSQGARW